MLPDNHIDGLGPNKIPVQILRPKENDGLECRGENISNPLCKGIAVTEDSYSTLVRSIRIDELVEGARKPACRFRVLIILLHATIWLEAKHVFRYRFHEEVRREVPLNVTYNGKERQVIDAGSSANFGEQRLHRRTASGRPPVGIMP